MRGVIETSDFNDPAGDALAAFDLLRTRPDLDPRHIFAHGIGQGGWLGDKSR